MFLQDIDQISIDKILRCVPRFEEKKLVYHRRENTETFTFYIANGKTQELSMNGEAWEVLKLCDGKRTIEDVSNIFASRYLDILTINNIDIFTGLKIIFLSLAWSFILVTLTSVYFKNTTL